MLRSQQISGSSEEEVKVQAPLLGPPTLTHVSTVGCWGQHKITFTVMTVSNVLISK